MKIGLVVDSPYLDLYMQQLLAKIEQCDALSVSHIIVINSAEWRSNVDRRFRFGSSRFRVGLDKVRSRVLGFVHNAENRKFQQVHPLAEMQGGYTKVDLPTYYVVPTFSLCGRAVRLSSRDLSEVNIHDCQFLIRGTRLFLTGAILDCCPWGVIGLHHGDYARFRGRPSGFWECFEDEPTTRFMIQRLTSTLDMGQILKVGSIKTSPYISTNTIRLHQAAQDALIEFIEDVATTRSLPPIIEIPDIRYPVRRQPTIAVVVQYIFKVHVVRRWFSV